MNDKGRKGTKRVFFITPNHCCYCPIIFVCEIISELFCDTNFTF